MSEVELAQFERELRQALEETATLGEREAAAADVARVEGTYWVEPWQAKPGEWVCAEWVPDGGDMPEWEGEVGHWLLPGDDNWWLSSELVTIDERRVERVGRHQCPVCGNWIEVGGGSDDERRAAAVGGDS